MAALEDVLPAVFGAVTQENPGCCVSFQTNTKAVICRQSVAHQDRACGVVRFADSQRGRSLMIPMHGGTT